MNDPGRRADGLPKPATDEVLGNEAEGYLLWRARVAEAEQRAREFTGRMDWLTTSQREEVERHHVHDGLLRARHDLERIAARCASLRREYEERYRLLRRRCVAGTLAVCLALVFLAALSLTR
ncbi:cytochrome C oxidase subunit I [Streptomyces sp. DSM 15324]|uniref:cytochrome C oxidase subunit I n=1 Tax=Streptomyces sp. DSM 15324 TaxID=1739111 RepID=UPI000836B1DC|nr:cytochrome C oxidase subunit I [Streptomyces sp. DSM 15324]